MKTQTQARYMTSDGHHVTVIQERNGDYSLRDHYGSLAATARLENGHWLFDAQDGATQADYLATDEMFTNNPVPEHLVQWHDEVSGSYIP